MKRLLTFLFCLPLLPVSGAPLPIDPLWKSDAFRRAMTASYGVDARIEPRLSSAEKEVLDAVARAMGDGDRKGAIAVLTASSLLSESAALLFSLGNLRFEEDDPENARENFANAIALYPNFRDAHRNLAVVLVQAGEFEAAEPHLIRAIELGAQDGLSFGLLGYCHLQSGRHAAALQAYRMAQMTMPREIQWKMGEAECLLALDSLTEAESLFAALLELNPRDGGIWLNQANVWLQDGDETKAAANLEFVRRMGTLEASGLLTLGHLYRNTGLTDRALSAWTEALSLETPLALQPALSILERLTQSADWPETRTWIEALEGQFEFEPETDAARSLQRAKALLELEDGDPAEGLKLVEALVAQDPLDGPALLLLARYRSNEGKSEEAVLLCDQAAAVPEVARNARCLQVVYLVSLNRIKPAIALLQEALDLEPNEPLERYLAQLRSMVERER